MLLASPAAAQEQPPAIQPAGREAPNGRQSPAGPASPTTAPTAAAQPTREQVLAQLPKVFGDLASDDPAAREAARSALMRLSRADLPAFERVVRASVPLVPAQAAVLKEIVTQIHLSDEEYPESPVQAGFLGVTLATVRIVIGPGDDEEVGRPQPFDVNPFDPRRVPAATAAQTTGVLISERYPGFCGARMLQDGDVVLGVVERPDQPIVGLTSMQETVRSFPAGETIHLQLLRQGQVIRVPITLDRRPEAANEYETMRRFIDERRTRSEQYWEQAFAPLLKEGVG